MMLHETTWGRSRPRLFKGTPHGPNRIIVIHLPEPQQMLDGPVTHGNGITVVVSIRRMASDRHSDSAATARMLSRAAPWGANQNLRKS